MILLKVKPSVNNFIEKEIRLFIKWVEYNYDFPRPLSFNITGAKYIINSVTGEKVIGSCYLPYSKSEHARINISTGDFFEIVKVKSKDQAVYSVLHTICHEIQHYYQWVDNLSLDEEEAELGANDLTCDYIKFREFKYD